MAKTKTAHDADGKTAPHQPQSRLDGIAEAARRAAEGVEINPIALVAGGLALGIVAGALLPRSERERALLAPVGTRLSASLTAAIDAAKEAGQAELTEAGISRDAARDQVRGLVDGLLKAATSAGGAAAQAAAAAGTGADAKAAHPSY